MMEVIRNAWLGWQNYNDSGKMAALVLIALLLFWFGRVENRKQYHTLVWYTTVMVVCCVCPLTAAVLMQYQTRFYDYQWIWGAVPVTIIIALAGTLLWTELVEKYAKCKKAGWKIAGITALLVAVIYLCGRMENDIWDVNAAAQNQEETVKVLEKITQNGQNQDITLWAPQGIMEYARALDGSICMPYGRNMWDGALNGYSYDTYGETEKLLYAWMSHAEKTGEGEVEIDMTVEMGMEITSDIIEADSLGENTASRTIMATECVELAMELGVNCMLLPENLESAVVEELETYLGIAAENVEGYYLFYIEMPY